MWNFEDFRGAFQEIIPSFEKRHPELEAFTRHAWVKYRLATFLKPQKIVEIGVRLGYSGWALIKGAGIGEDRYFGVDAYNGQHGGGDRNSGFYEVAVRTLHPGTIVVADSQTLTDIEPSQFYHVDANHDFDAVVHDIRICSQHILPGGAILIDDYDFMPTVRRAVDTFEKENSNYLKLYIESLRGEALLIRQI